MHSSHSSLTEIQTHTHTMVRIRINQRYKCYTYVSFWVEGLFYDWRVYAVQKKNLGFDHLYL